MCSSLGHKKNKQNINSPSIFGNEKKKQLRDSLENLLCALKELQLTPLSAKRRL